MAQRVFEFGCGTGALAERLLASHLEPSACYAAVDSSPTMILLAQARLARFGSRVEMRGFRLEYVGTVVACGIPSEIVIAKR